MILSLGSLVQPTFNLELLSDMRVRFGQHVQLAIPRPGGHEFIMPILRTAYVCVKVGGPQMGGFLYMFLDTNLPLNNHTHIS